MKIAAILVSFDPSRDVLAPVAGLRGLVDTIVVVDNREGSGSDLFDLARREVVVIRNDNVGGLAGAYNRALDWIGANRTETSHILFLDDDSDLSALETFLASPATQDATARHDIAAVAPIYRDRRTGLRGRHIALDRFRFRFLAREHDKPDVVTFVINSMSLWRRDALQKIGPYSETLAIDHIDTDYAMRAKRAGYRIILNAEVEFLHEIGERRQYKLFGRTVQSGGHSANRRFLIGRNTVIIAKKHGLAYPAFLALCVQRLAYETIGIIAAENDKIRKLAALWRGALLGLTVRA